MIVLHSTHLSLDWRKSFERAISCLAFYNLVHENTWVRFARHQSSGKLGDCECAIANENNIHNSEAKVAYIHARPKNGILVPVASTNDTAIGSAICGAHLTFQPQLGFQ